MLSSVTCTAPVNIAVIKYWGKRDEHLILPLNDSISVTLSQQHMCARTTVKAIADASADCANGVPPLELWLNGERQPISARLTSCVQLLYSSAIAQKGALPSHRLIIESSNSFPTAAGLASSAAGFAALATAVARVYRLGDDSDAAAAVRAARLGSGSACRSMLGGFVRWRRGQMEDGSDSLAEQILPASGWPSLYCLILVVSDERKSVPSSRGMTHTVHTSSLMPARLGVHALTAPLAPATDNAPVQKRAERMCQAITERDFTTFAELCMRDSNEMHAICASAFPPVHYMNDTSRGIVQLVHAYNAWLGRVAVCYTFDAGSNACCYLLKKEVSGFVDVVREVCSFSVGDEGWLRGETVPPVEGGEKKEGFVWEAAPLKTDAVKYVICSKVGEAPIIVCED